MTNLKLDSSTSSFLDQSSPEWEIYQRSLADFGGDELIVIALEAQSPFNRATLEEVFRLTSALQDLPGVRRVDSLATVPLIRASENGELILSAGLNQGIPEKQADFDRLLVDFRRDAIAPNSLFSNNERVFAINVLLDDDVVAGRTEIVLAIRDLLTLQNVRASGVPLFRTEVNRRTYQEVFIFIPVTLLLMAIVVSLAFSSFRPIVVPLAVGGVSSLTVVGTMSLLDIPLSLSTMVLPTILLALGCAYSMHVLAAAQGISERDQFRFNLEHVANPVALSGMTTAIGFLSMATVSIAAIEQLALLGALGVATLTISSLNLAPAILTMRPIPGRDSIFTAYIDSRLRHKVLILADRYRMQSISVWFVLLVVLTGGLFSLRISTDIIVWFPEGTEIRDDYEAVREQLSGISPVNVVLTAYGNRLVTAPAVIRKIDELSTWLELQPEVGKSLAVTDPLRQLHDVLSPGNDTRLPPSQELVEQYILLLESVEYLQDLLTSDRKRANILLRVDDNGSDHLVALGERIGGWWAENGLEDFSVTTTGLMYEFGRSEERIAYGQIQGLVIALFAIGAVLLGILRSPKHALLALLPNAVPLLIAFGLMGFMGIPIDAATVCLGSLALGIAVDDTIHIMTKYSEQRGLGHSPLVAMDRSLEKVLRALVFTTVAVSCGFGVLAFSEFTLIHHLGLVTSGLVLLCLLSDLTLLAPLVLLVDRKHSSDRCLKLK